MHHSDLLATGYLYRKYDESPRTGMRLGRQLWLDGRSLAFMVENRGAVMGRPLASVEHERVLAILDQGDLGSCTGNAGTGALGTQPVYDAVGRGVLPDPGDAAAAEQFAVQLYGDATRTDGYPGVYPPDDTGSSGLAICKVLKARGMISGYRWARSPHGMLQLLQDGPVLQGMPWYEAFFTPDADGFIDSDPGWAASGLAGGHEIEAVAVEVDQEDLYDSVVTYCNSWGTAWADSGRFRMRLRTLGQLEGLDLKQYVVSA